MFDKTYSARVIASVDREEKLGNKSFSRILPQNPPTRIIIMYSRMFVGV